jgi:hypothetical protein
MCAQLAQHTQSNLHFNNHISPRKMNALSLAQATLSIFAGRRGVNKKDNHLGECIIYHAKHPPSGYARSLQMNSK